MNEHDADEFVDIQESLVGLPSNSSLLEYLYTAGLTKDDLGGMDFSYQALQEFGLDQANFCGADLNGANLNESDLSRANLVGVSLSHAQLHNANLSEANFRNANLTNADLTHANLAHADLTDADLSGAILKYVNLTSANLSQATLKNTNLTSASLRRSLLKNTDFTNANLTSANLMNASFNNTNLSNANLSNANLNKCRGSFSFFSGVKPVFKKKALRSTDNVVINTEAAKYKGVPLTSTNIIEAINEVNVDMRNGRVGRVVVSSNATFTVGNRNSWVVGSSSAKITVNSVGGTGTRSVSVIALGKNANPVLPHKSTIIKQKSNKNITEKKKSNEND